MKNMNIMSSLRLSVHNYRVHVEISKQGQCHSGVVLLVKKIKCSKLSYSCDIDVSKKLLWFKY